MILCANSILSDECFGLFASPDMCLLRAAVALGENP